MLSVKIHDTVRQKYRTGSHYQIREQTLWGRHGYQTCLTYFHVVYHKRQLFSNIPPSPFLKVVIFQ